MVWEKLQKKTKPDFMLPERGAEQSNESTSHTNKVNLLNRNPNPLYHR